jgi:hypothetical protein
MDSGVQVQEREPVQVQVQELEPVRVLLAPVRVLVVLDDSH